MSRKILISLFATVLLVMAMFHSGITLGSGGGHGAPKKVERKVENTDITKVTIKGKPASATGEKENSETEAKAEEKDDKEPLAVTPEALQELQARRDSLEKREKELDDRSRALDIQEKLLQEKLRRMEELNQKMAERLESYKNQNDGKVKKLVTMLETMRPQAAASYLESVDPYLAVEVLTRIDVTKAAKVMNLVDKKRSARLTELYAGYRDEIADDKNKKEVEKQ